MNLFLIGYRGTGKSAVAPLVAQKLNLDWLDADDQIERRSGKTISEIFASQGEAEFRDLESQVISDLAKRDNLVLALGGGAVLREENRLAIRGRGKVIWLAASVETIHRRIAADFATAQRRPNLTVGGLAEIRELLAIREPLYRSCADHAIDTDAKTPEEVAAEIVTILTR